jgi:hypothetical protein
MVTAAESRLTAERATRESAIRPQTARRKAFWPRQSGEKRSFDRTPRDGNSFGRGRGDGEMRRLTEARLAANPRIQILEAQE